MTGAEFKAIRTELGCTGETFARALGYGGKVQTLRSLMYLYETGRRDIPDTVARLVVMFGRYGIPKRMGGDTVTRLVTMFTEYGIPKDVAVWPQRHG